MDDSSLPPEVRRLIDESLESMDHVEVLFRVARHGQTTPDWLARDAHIDQTRVTRVLRDLERANLVADDDGVFCVASGARDRAAVEQFADMYNTRPVTLIRAVYAHHRRCAHSPTPFDSAARTDDGRSCFGGLYPLHAHKSRLCRPVAPRLPARKRRMGAPE